MSGEALGGAGSALGRAICCNLRASGAYMRRMSSYSDQLLAIGRRVLEPYSKLEGAACAAITGSSAEGLSDEFSDLDMTVYYARLPPEAAILAVREQVGGGPVTWRIGEHSDGEFAMAFRVQGVECQIGHVTIERWEADMERVLRGEELASPLHKAMSGTLISIATLGPELLEKWKSRLRAYPDSLAAAMVKHHLQFFPTWGLLPRLGRRNAELWMRQVMVESSFNVVGALAGLNRQYFTPFQFKRTSAFFRTFTISPPALGERLDALWKKSLPDAAMALRELVAETVDLIEQHMPGVDTTAARKALARNDPPWTSDPLKSDKSRPG
ncbi:hypothetical protein BH09PLA1_BH09PLA1_02920 [soil metagenome]